MTELSKRSLEYKAGLSIEECCKTVASVTERTLMELRSRKPPGNDPPDEQLPQLLPRDLCTFHYRLECERMRESTQGDLWTPEGVGGGHAGNDWEAIYPCLDSIRIFFADPIRSNAWNRAHHAVKTGDQRLPVLSSMLCGLKLQKAPASSPSSLDVIETCRKRFNIPRGFICRMLSQISVPGSAGSLSLVCSRGRSAVITLH